MRWIDTPADLLAFERMPAAEAVPVSTTAQLLARNAEQFGEQDALLFLESPDRPDEVLRISHRRLFDDVARAASLFRASGVERGDTVAILAPHMPSTHVAIWGAQLAGRAFPVNYLLGADHIAALLRASNAKAAVILGATPELTVHAALRDAIAQAGCVAHVFEIDPCESAPAPGSFQHRVSTAHDDGATLAQELDAETVASLYHTGGTTGLPKLLTHSHRNEVHTSWFAARFYRFGPGDRMLNGFPLFHVAGAFVYGLASLAAGGSIFIPTLTGMRNTRFMSRIWEIAQRHRVTHLGCVPTVLSALLNGSPDAAPARGDPTVRAALTGGSPLPADLAARFEQRFAIPVRNIFGMTECVGVVSIEPVGAARIPGSAGLPLPLTRVCAIPLEDGCPTRVRRVCAPGETGQLAISGPHVSRGYLDAAANASTFTQDGWLLSGDLGHVDADGRVFLTGRAKDLIIRGGHNLDPRAIEEAVLGIDDVVVCAAVGEPDAYAGELPVVFVVLRAGSPLDAQALHPLIRERIHEPPAMPRRIIVLEALPLTAIGKIYKPALRAHAARVKLLDLLAAQLPPARCDVQCMENKGRLRATVTLDASTHDAVPDRVKLALAGLDLDIEWRVGTPLPPQAANP
ncbi:AMP-binding protein [Paraburkholderia acidisoli]|uniref:AMP-binding protein n=2 Tax=Paraburkholderia acidisoli TaxID=2571748 RepID=A0A7Z2JIK9_9BURK|nr:AMP-binding protein [Paraburkholderia acidisoli]